MYSLDVVLYNFILWFNIVLMFSKYVSYKLRPISLMELFCDHLRAIETYHWLNQNAWASSKYKYFPYFYSAFFFS